MVRLTECSRTPVVTAFMIEFWCLTDRIEDRLLTITRLHDNPRGSLISWSKMLCT